MSWVSNQRGKVLEMRNSKHQESRNGEVTSSLADHGKPSLLVSFSTSFAAMWAGRWMVEI